MSDPGTVERLRGIPLFAGLDEEALVRMASLFGEVDAPAGQVIVERGHVGSGMFLLEEEPRIAVAMLPVLAHRLADTLGA